jgi:16S rRNA (guanine527-N7)-methyltransferase
VGLRDIAGVLSDRAAHAGVIVSDELAARLLVYFQVLTHWNRKINLTSLSNADEAVDRLLLEPVAAALHLPRAPELIDLGSGGGSPAIPLALALRVGRLVMVESRERKAAFLREALRELGMSGSVETARFEDLPNRKAFRGTFGLASIRAVKLDEVALETLATMLAPRGYAALFRALDSAAMAGLPPTLRWVADHRLVPASHSELTVLQK